MLVYQRVLPVYRPKNTFKITETKKGKDGVSSRVLRLHKATPISNGRRHNLILWCRSSGVRNDLCPMCFKEPNVVATNRYYHEGFTVPPCDASMVQDVPDMSSDDLYDWGIPAFPRATTKVFFLGWSVPHRATIQRWPMYTYVLIRDHNDTIS